MKFPRATYLVSCFQHKDDAEKFLTALINRLAKFNLKIAEDKTKMFMFGRFAEENLKRRGLGKPQTFDFLGFTHYGGKSRNGKFRVKHRTSRKKFKAKIKDFKEWIKSVRNCDTADIMRTVRAKLLGHYRYYGITDNSRMIAKYMYEIIKLLFKWLNRRSQRKSFTVEKFRLFLARHKLPTPKIYVSIYG